MSLVPGGALGKRSYAMPYRKAKYRRTSLYTPRVPRRNLSSLNARTAALLGIEKKYVDYEWPRLDMATTVIGSEYDPLTVNQLSGVAIGDGEFNRDGRKITIKSLHLRGTISSTGADNDGQCVRIILVQDTQTNGAQFTAQQVLAVPSTPALAVEAFRNLDYIQRFRILKDKTFVLNVENGSTSPRTIRHLSWNINNLNIQVNHNDSGNTVAGVTDNSFHLICIAQRPSTVFNYVCRTRFVG